MVFLVKEYKIPFLGKVQFLESNKGYVHTLTGRYYSESERKPILCDNCNSVDELIESTCNKIRNYLEIEADLSERRIEKEKEEKRKLELILCEMKSLKNLDEIKAWLKKYQTDNFLQLEFQHKVIEFIGDDQ